MNNLSTAIIGILSRQGRKYADLVKASGISSSALSQIVNGTPCSPGNLTRLMEHISPHSEERAELIRAHLFDELERSGVPVGLVHISTPSEDRESLRGILTSEVYGWLYSIAVAIAEGNDEFEGIVEELAHLARRLKKEKNWEYGGQAAEDSREYPANGSTNSI
jgi:hypothetical protein